ncbi:MAG: hypothetical protein F8N37_20840 [Telmatospirillum sp.]|nr:hypothetical protein [Telmatospirillum sp.]
MQAETVPRLLRETPVPVTVTVGIGNDGADIAVFHVGQDKNGVVKTEVFPSNNNDLADQVVWRPPYLAVISRSSGNCWNCTGEAVFKIVDDRAVRIGDINLDYLPEAVPALPDGQFLTRYAKLESQAGFCHACSPSFMVVLTEQAGRLVIDAQATWAANAGLWSHAQDVAATLAAHGMPRGNSDERFAWELDGFRDLVSAAALAKYCDRPDLLKDYLDRLTPHLPSALSGRLNEALALVSPLEPVSQWNSNAPY